MRIQVVGRPILILAVSVVLALTACSTPVPPTVMVAPTGRFGDDVAFRVVANREAPRVVRSLENAGLRVAADSANAAYLLEARIGRSRGRSSCGSTRNVIFTVKAGEARVLVVKGRGKTGDCEPNVLDQLSRSVASYR